MLLTKIPLVGPTAARLVGAVATFRDEKRYVFTAAAISLCSNTLFILSFYFIARGLPVHAASLAEHFVIVPVANLAGAIPATPSGLGTLELAIEKLYLAVSDAAVRRPGDGTLVALGQRASMVAVACVCLAFYLTQRNGLRNVLREADAEANAEGAASVP
jgi:hypothetical protein